MRAGRPEMPERGPSVPTLPRRSVIGVSALGITGLVLPSAVAAASVAPGLSGSGDPEVDGAYVRTGTVDTSGEGTLTTYLVLTHTGTVGTTTSYDVTLDADLAGVEWLVVAGGGAGGGNRGAGGGAGGLRVGSPSGGLLAAATYRITVGGGGVAPRVARFDTAAPGGDGSGSAIGTPAQPDSLVSTVGGGGGGSRVFTGGRREGGSGGSGGGGGDYVGTAGGAGTAGEGNPGAAAGSSGSLTGGGGGAGQAAGGTGGAGANRRRDDDDTTTILSDGGDGVAQTAWCLAARSSSGPEVGEWFPDAGTEGAELFLAGGGAGFVSGTRFAGVGGGRTNYGGKTLAVETLQDGLPHTGGGGGALEAFYNGGATGDPADAEAGTASGGRAGHGGSGVVLLRWPSAGDVTLSITQVA